MGYFLMSKRKKQEIMLGLKFRISTDWLLQGLSFHFFSSQLKDEIKNLQDFLLII